MGHYCLRILQSENQIDEPSIVFLPIYIMPCSKYLIYIMHFKEFTN